MTALTVMFTVAIVAVVAGSVGYALAASHRERLEAAAELAERTGEHRIIPVPYPDDEPGRPLHGAHRRGGRRG